ncbi:hypothetical protein V9T40_014323 [Parthenolecanium corni]|uniref:Uncharacterized protein n=1 Tax=Parthenolecanium corni TaxID=536013 RepID=A0AAN9T5N7_9HEMI
MIHSIMSSMSYIPENSEESLTGDWATRLNDSYLHDSREDLVLKISSIVHDNEVITTAWDVNKNRVRSIHVNIANYTRTPRDPAYDKEQLLFISALMQ